MAKIGRPRAEVIVTDAECGALLRLTKRGRVNRAVAFRAGIVLARCESPRILVSVGTTIVLRGDADASSRHRRVWKLPALGTHGTRPQILAKPRNGVAQRPHASSTVP